MSIHPPKIDQRSYHDLVQQTQDLAQTYTSWHPPALPSQKGSPPSQPDAGLALIRIFGHMATLVRDRLNRVPDRNLMAFINLIGTQLTPPQPARVPITFHLAEGSPVDALVPAHTQLSAPALEGEKEDVVFETEGELLVSETALKAMFVVEDRDYYSDRSDRLSPVTADQSDAFLAFHGEQPVEHYLYLYCEELFKLPELTTITITIDTDSAASAAKLQELLLDWVCWQETDWQTLPHVQIREPQLPEERSQVTVIITQLPILLPVEINGIKAPWLRVGLKPYRREYLPEVTQVRVSASIDQTHAPKDCWFNTSILDLSKDFHPFGVTPRYNDSFVMALNPKLIKPGVAIEIAVNLTHAPSFTEDLELIWEVGDGQNWHTVETSQETETFRWGRDSAPLKLVGSSTSAIIHFPDTFPPLPSDRSMSPPDYQIRARLVQGLYGTKGRERKYVIYNDVTLVAQAIAKGQKDIIVDGVDEIEIGDVIRIQSVNGPAKQEDAKVINKIPAEKKLVLDPATRNAYEAGSRILSKFTITENTPDVIDPPLIQSIALTYKFLLNRPARYYAYNDFIFGDSRPVSVRLRQAAKAGDRVIQLDDDVSQFSVGEFLKFDDNSEKRQIELIDPARNGVIFTQGLDSDHARGGRVERSFHPLTPQINRHSALYLGFNQAFPNRPNTLYLQVEAPQPEEVAPGAARASDMNLQRIGWEYASPQGWLPLVVADETQALAEQGLIQFIGPTDFIPSAHFGQPLYWLRARKKSNDWANIPFSLIYLFQWAIAFRQVNLFSLIRYLAIKIGESVDFAVPPRVRSVRTNTTWASQTITLANEILGSSNSEPNQGFFTSHFPVLSDQQLDVQEGRMPSEADQVELLRQFGPKAIAPIADETGRLETVWVRWQEVPDFYSSRPGDRHYVVDRQTGHIQFGNGQAGLIPPRGRNNIRLVQYRTGGGIRGNRAAQTIVELKTTIPYIDSVINWEAARGGSEQESLDRLKERSPQRLRNRDRAVTAQDFEDLTYEASIDVARVQVITPEMMAPNFSPLLEELWIDPQQPTAPTQTAVAGNDIQVFSHDIRAGRVQVLIVPHSPDRQPTPNLALINRVETFLQARFVSTMKLRVTGPKWQEIRVITELVPMTVTTADAVRVAAEQRIHQFLHPLTGGNQGSGWSFGRTPHPSDIYSILEAVPGVRYVRFLEIQPNHAAIDQQTLIYSGQHVVTLKVLGEMD